MQEAKSVGNLKKLAAIPVLLVILVVVMRSSSTSEELVSEYPSVISPTTTKDMAISAEVVRRDREWPELVLEDLLDHNPFSNSLLVQEAKLTNSSKSDSNLIKVDAFLSSDRGTVAMAEKKVYRVGDQIPDGRIVDSVTPEFIYLKQAKPRR